MGYICRLNDKDDPARSVVEEVKYFTKSSLENRKFKNRTEEESRDLAQFTLQLTAKDNFIIEGKCYVGLTANFVQSLAAHGVDHYDDTAFFCMKLPADRAKECKRVRNVG